jgi:hypothetical protein
MAEELGQTPELAEDKTPGQLLKEALSFLLHMVISMLVLLAVGGVITLAQPQSFSMALAAALAFVVPALAGFVIARIRNDSVARYIWIAGILWMSIVMVWVLDMPTGPGLCEKCDAGNKIWLSFFDFTHDSGLINGLGRVVGTWPALAMVGYAIGAGFGLKKKAEED